MKAPSLKTILACAWLATFPIIVSAADATQANTLTDTEKKAGWKLLFDGKTSTGWRGYQMAKMPPGWQVIDGALVRVSGGAGGKGAGGGDDIFRKGPICLQDHSDRTEFRNIKIRVLPSKEQQ